jgi:tetratricopeptide (TPR) repeat protein
MAYQRNVSCIDQQRQIQRPVTASPRLRLLCCVLAGFCVCDTTAVRAQEPWEKSRRAGADAREHGQYREARRWLEEARSEAPFEAGDLRRADFDDELAAVCQVLGDEREAERLYADAQNVLDLHPGDGNDIRAVVLGGIGLFRIRQGRLSEAEKALGAALESGRKAFGEHDVRMATVQSAMAQLYLVEEKPRSAEPLLQAAIDVLKKNGRASHAHDLVVAEVALGALYTMDGRYPAAESALLEAEETARPLGDSTPELAVILTNLADLYRVEGRSSRGVPLLRRAQAMYTTAFGADSPRVAEILLDRSIDDIFSNKPGLAEESILQALNTLRRANGPDHTAVALGELRLAQAYILERKYTEAERLLDHAVEVQQRTYPEGHQLVAETLEQLAELHRLENHFPEAEALYRRAIAAYEKIGPPGAPSLAITLREYAKLLRTTRVPEAKALEKRADGLASEIRAFR